MIFILFTSLLLPKIFADQLHVVVELQDIPRQFVHAVLLLHLTEEFLVVLFQRSLVQLRNYLEAASDEESLNPESGPLFELHRLAGHHGELGSC